MGTRLRRHSTSVGSVDSVAAVGSIRSVASTGSILSIASAGSILSVGSAGSLLSIGSSGSILSRDADGRVLHVGSRRMTTSEVIVHAAVVAAAGIAVGVVCAGAMRLFR